MLGPALVIALFAAKAADLPPGAVMRLGDARWRAAHPVEHLALSPDGKRFVTSHKSARATRILTTWDAGTGCQIHTQEVNEDLFRGLRWGTNAGHAVVTRAEPGAADRRARLFPGDFRVWAFTDPSVAAPPLLSARTVGLSGLGSADADPQPGKPYTDFQFSNDSSRLAAKASSNAVHVFDLKPAESATKLTCIGRLDLGSRGAEAVRLSGDGTTIVTFNVLAPPDKCEEVATVWDVLSGKPSESVRVPRTERRMVTPDARSLVAFVTEGDRWGYDSVDLATGKSRPLARWDSGPTTATPAGDWGGFAFAPSGRELLVVSGRRAHVIDVVAGKERGRLEVPTARVPPDNVQIQTAWSSDGTRIATADESGLVRLWDANTLRPLNEPQGHRAPISHAELSPDGKQLLTLADDETLRVWDIDKGKELRAFAGLPPWIGDHPVAHQPTFTPDGRSVVFSVVNPKESRLIARDVLTGLEVPLPGDLAKQQPSFATFSSQGTALLTCSAGSNVFEVWDWPNGNKRFSVRAKNTPLRPGFSPDGSVIFACVTAPERWDAKTGKPLSAAWDSTKDPDPFAATSLQPNPRLVVQKVNDKPQILAAGTMNAVPGYRFPIDPDEAKLTLDWPVAFSPDGCQFATASDTSGAPVRLHEASTGKVRRMLTRHHGGTITILGFTPDGTRLLTAGDDCTVLVWDVRPQSMPLPPEVRRETDAAKLWNRMCVGKAEESYLAMARLAIEPEAAVGTARMRMKPATADHPDTAPQRLADSRAIELLESLGTPEARDFLKELAKGDATAFRTQEAKRAVERLEKTR